MRKTIKKNIKKDNNEEKLIWADLHKEMTSKGIKMSFFVNRIFTLAKDNYSSTIYDNYRALAFTIRDRIVERWMQTQQRYHKENLKRVYYLSMEFLIGRLLGNFIYNLGIEKQTYEAVEDLGFDVDELREQEADAGLGNGGLGRLAACFLDSMATLSIPAHGYGIRYDYGIFKQKIENGNQVEIPDEWLSLGCPWEFPRPEYTVTVKFYGRVDTSCDFNNNLCSHWVDTQDVLAVPYDIPIIGYKNDVVNTLRLWSARSTEGFDLEYFNNGDYEEAVYRKIFSENISKVLYPNDSQSDGKELRLKQEYFFSAASIFDIIRRFKAENTDLRLLHEKVSIQLNDTHPALSIAELMRTLIDDYNIDWMVAWEITRKTFGYTNHTLLPEALETWSVPLLEKVLPRHLQIIYEINSWFIDQIQKEFPGDGERIARMSLVQEGDVKLIRMANLSVVGSHSVNGVSDLHSKLLKAKLFKDFDEMYPSRFNNKTNGITQRRWLLKANPRLSEMITWIIGDKWTTDLTQLKKILPYKEKKSFRDKWEAIKSENKKELSNYIFKTMNVSIDPDTLFDVQVKRIHEYKRQLLFAFYIISQYLMIKNDPKKFKQPRTFMVGGKAAPGYFMAKLMIKFINNIGSVINKDKSVMDKIKVIFLENYRVSLAEKIFPASDLSEQISTAGKEASGTGNMKFMLNGALTIGTLDGANVEINNYLGGKDIFIFGLQEHEIEAMLQEGYDPQYFVQKSPMLYEVFKLIKNNFFSLSEPGIFEPIIQSVFYHDEYFVCADFDSYCKMQEVVSDCYQDKTKWIKSSITNVANSGEFSSDRTIREYAKDIWDVPCK